MECINFNSIENGLFTNCSFATREHVQVNMAIFFATAAKLSRRMKIARVHGI